MAGSRVDGDRMPTIGPAAEMLGLADDQAQLAR